MSDLITVIRMIAKQEGINICRITAIKPRGGKYLYYDYYYQLDGIDTWIFIEIEILGDDWDKIEAKAFGG